MKRIGQIIGAAIVGTVCVVLLPLIVLVVIGYTLFAVVAAIIKAIQAAINAKPVL